MGYDDLEFKEPEQSADYVECSAFVTTSIEEIMQASIDSGRNQIIINTNLKLGLPMENINKIAGPMVEAWAFEVFHDVILRFAHFLSSYRNCTDPPINLLGKS